MSAGRQSGLRDPARLRAYAAGMCLAGSGLALFAATREWSVQVTARPGLSDLREARTGAAVLPWLPALALVGVAGVGALLATRGPVRRVVGALLMAVGAALVTGVAVARVGLDPGAAGAGGTLWPVAAAVGGALLVVSGWWAVRHGHRWPAMGARYGRPAADGPHPAPPGSAGTGSAAAVRPGSDGSGQRQDVGPVDTRAAWDALDRGDDPTLD